jgi:hypothetical protein
VRGANGGSGNAIPPHVIPERGQRPEDLAPDLSVVEREDVGDVLHEDVAGSKLAHGSGHLSPEDCLRVAEALLLAGRRGALAREATGDDVDGFCSSSANCSDVVEQAGVGEPSGEDGAAEWVDLAEPPVPEAGGVEAVGEEPDAVEEPADRRGIHSSPPRGLRTSPTTQSSPYVHR